MTEPARSAADAAELLASGSVSSVELTECFLDRIERLNPILHAVIATAPGYESLPGALTFTSCSGCGTGSGRTSS